MQSCRMGAVLPPWFMLLFISAQARQAHDRCGQGRDRDTVKVYAPRGAQISLFIKRDPNIVHSVI